MKLKKSYLIIGVAIAIVMFMVIRARSKNSVEYEEFTVEKRDIIQSLELSGEVDAHQKEDLRFQASGLVTYLPFQVGDEVKKFQTIASLDQRALKKTLKKYLNTYGKELHDFDQTHEDNEGEIESLDISDELRRTLEQSQYDLENAVLDVELQDLSIKLSRIYAPFDGILIRSPITSPNVNIAITGLFTIVNPESLYLKADIDESDLSQVTSSQRVLVELDAFPEEVIESSISKISFDSKETATGTTYEVDITLPPSFMPKLRLGLNGTAQIILSEKQNILTLPSEAINESEDKTFVYIFVDRKLQEKEITIGITNDTYTEILSGLSEGDKVIVSENPEKLKGRAARRLIRN